MVSKAVEWINAQKVKGYSEEQIRQHLIKHRFNPKEIDKAIIESRDKSGTDLDKLLLEKGKLFRTLFYIITIIFSLQLLGEILGLLISIQLVALIFPAIFAWTMINYVRKRDLYKVLMTIFLLSPTSVAILLTLPLIKSFLSIGNTPFYVFIAIYTLLLGLLVSFMLSKVSENFKRYIMSSIIFSSILGIIFAIVNVTGFIILKLSEALSRFGANSINPAMGFDLSSFFNSEIIDANIAFCIAFVCFNIPYIIFYSKNKERHPKFAMLYVIPILIYILLSLTLKYIVSMLAFGGV